MGGQLAARQSQLHVLAGVFGRGVIQCSHRRAHQQGRVGHAQDISSGLSALTVAELLWWMRVAEGSGWQSCSTACAEVERMPKELMRSFA
jgi:hypothetical protein